MATDLYDQDLYAWTEQQAKKLRAGRLVELDAEHLAEELEEFLGNLQRELYRRLRVLVGHLLKWQYQPDRRSSSWRGSIRSQRLDIARLFKQNPSLRRFLSEALRDAYGDAVELAADDTGLPVETFPGECPFTAEQVLSKDFWPES
jgi:hypothetical protein